MTAPQRYTAHTQARADAEGKFVLYTEYQALEQQLLDECTRHEDRIRQCEQQAARIAQLEAEAGKR